MILIGIVIIAGAVLFGLYLLGRTKIKDPLAISTAFFTAVLCIVGFLQWCTLQSTEDVLKKTNEISAGVNRAFVLLEAMPLVGWPPQAHPPKSFAISVKVTNSGNTTARSLQIRFACPHPRNEGPLIRDAYERVQAEWKPITADPPTFFGPRQSLTLQACEFPLETYALIKGQQIQYFVVAEATYFDAFSKVPRVTRMTVRFNIDDTDGYAYGPVGPHNCADDDCPK